MLKEEKEWRAEDAGARGAIPPLCSRRRARSFSLPLRCQSFLRLFVRTTSLSLSQGGSLVDESREGGLGRRGGGHEEASGKDQGGKAAGAAASRMGRAAPRKVHATPLCLSKLSLSYPPPPRFTWTTLDGCGACSRSGTAETSRRVLLPTLFRSLSPSFSFLRDGPSNRSALSIPRSSPGEKRAAEDGGQRLAAGCWLHPHGHAAGPLLPLLPIREFRFAAAGSTLSMLL